MGDDFEKNFQEELFLQHQNERVNSIIIPRLKKNIRMNGKKYYLIMKNRIFGMIQYYS